MPRFLPERSKSPVVHLPSFTRLIVIFSGACLTPWQHNGTTETPRYSIYKHSFWGVFCCPPEGTLNHSHYAIVTGMFVRVVTISTLISAIVLALVLTFVSPASAGPFGLLILFISAYMTFVGLIAGILYGFRRLMIALLQGVPRSVPLRPLTLRRAYHFAVPLAAAPVMLIGLQSVSPIGLREFLLVAVFEAIACIYISKRIR